MQLEAEGDFRIQQVISPVYFPQSLKSLGYQGNCEPLLLEDSEYQDKDRRCGLERGMIPAELWWPVVS